MAKRANDRGREEWVIVCVFALGAVAFTSAFFLPRPDDWLGLLTVVALTGLSERFAVKLYFDGRVSVSFVGTVLAALLFGPVGAALAATAVVLSAQITSGRPVKKFVFNFGHANVAAIVAAAAVLGSNAGEHLKNPLIAIGAAPLLGCACSS